MCFMEIQKKRKKQKKQSKMLLKNTSAEHTLNTVKHSYTQLKKFHSIIPLPWPNCSIILLSVKYALIINQT